MPKEKLSHYKADLFADLADQRYAAQYLATALGDSRETFLLALKDVAESRKISKVAETAHLNRESLYRMLSGSGNPTLSSLTSVLGVLGLRLTIQPATENGPKHDAPLFMGSETPKIGLTKLEGTQRKGEPPQSISANLIVMPGTRSERIPVTNTPSIPRKPISNMVDPNYRPARIR